MSLVVKSLSLDWYTNIKQSHTVPAHTVGEGMGDLIISTPTRGKVMEKVLPRLPLA